MSGKSAGDWDAVMGRLATAIGASSDADLARALGISTSDFAQRKGRRKVPWDRVILLAGARSVSVDWIVSGIGAEACASQQGRQSAAPIERASEPIVPPVPQEHPLAHRIGALAGLLVQLDPGHSDAILADALARATDAQRLSALEQAVKIGLTAQRSG